MTFKLLGMTDEERLDFEQASGIKTESAMLIAQATIDHVMGQVDSAIREVQEVIGPHGSVTRLQAGGVRVEPGTGIGVYLDGILKTTIDAEGNLFVGSDINQVSTTTFSCFVTDQDYNGEAMLAGDILIGDNSETVGNVKYDTATGQLQFRYGSTIKAYMDTDGSIKAGSGNVYLDDTGITLLATEYPTATAYIKWKDSAGTTLGGIVSQYIAGTGSNTWIQNRMRAAAEESYAGFIAQDENGATKVFFNIQATGSGTLNLEDAVNTAAGQQGFYVRTKVAATAVGNTVLTLSSKSSGTPAVGFGTFAVFQAHNVPKDEVLTQLSLGAVYEISTDDHEKSRTESYRLFDGALVREMLAEPDQRWTSIVEADFIHSNEPLIPAAFAAGGTVTPVAGEADHPGILRLSSVATNNTGAAVRTLAPDGTSYLDVVLIGGGEMFSCVFRIQSTATQNISILGYNDATAATAPTDGIWINVAAATVTGKTANNTTTSTTGTSYTATTATWYRAVVLVNTAASIVYFFLYNAATDALLWSDTLSTNIPSARATGLFSKAYRTNNVATDIIDLDWMAYYNLKEAGR